MSCLNWGAEMAGQKKNPVKVPVGNPNQECNTGYAEAKPQTKRQAQIPGAEPEPDGEDGGLEHDPDPET